MKACAFGKAGRFAPRLCLIYFLPAPCAGLLLINGNPRQRAAVRRMHAIETQKLCKNYNGLKALDCVDLEIARGETFGLLGPNGAGKTTLISILSTLTRASGGRALVAGLDVARQQSAVRRAIGIVFQDPSLDEKLTGRENLLLHCSLYAVPPADRAARTDWALDLVELTARQNDVVRKYSGGMRRRLEIARSLLHTPQVLFLDEPTLGLDPQTRDHIWVYLEKLKQQGITTILTTHYMDEADRLCDRIALIDFGKISMVDTPRRLKRRLGENLITLMTDEPQPLLDLLKDMPGGNHAAAQVHDGRLVLTVDSPERALSEIFRQATAGGIAIKSVNIHQPTLNDVFLKFTGRELRDEVGGQGDRNYAQMMRKRK
jgi:ABC-2 type transport system ATP-binding protein